MQGHALGSSVPVPEKMFMKSTIGTQFCSLHLIDETNSGGWLLGLVAEVSSKYDLLPCGKKHFENTRKPSKAPLMRHCAADIILPHTTSLSNFLLPHNLEKKLKQ